MTSEETGMDFGRCFGGRIKNWATEWRVRKKFLNQAVKIKLAIRELWNRVIIIEEDNFDLHVELLRWMQDIHLERHGKQVEDRLGQR